MGVGKPGNGETLREDISCPCWASQLCDSEPFANSIDCLTCSECSLEWSGVEHTLPRGAFSPLDGTTEAASRGRHAQEIEWIITIMIIVSIDVLACCKVFC